MDKDKGIITKIIEYTENIQNAQKRFGNDYDKFVSDRDYYNSVCMCLLQIGELSHHLTTGFTVTHNEIPWKSVVGLRNQVVHGYGSLDTETIWATVIEDIPVLYQKCKAIIESLSRTQPGYNNDEK
jgi:uncharacterized protein with HEPN domain